MTVDYTIATISKQMFQPFILAIGLIPLLFRIGPLVLPETWLEPYGYWSSKDLNLMEGQDKPTTFWRNQGYWRVCLSFSLGEDFNVDLA
jgi:hypothetical protein